MYVIVSLFYLLHPWPSLSPRDLWLSNARHRKKFPRFWVGRHILRPQLSVMLGKHEPLNPIFLSIGSLYHHVGSNVSVLSWYEMLTSLFLLYGKCVSDAAVPLVSTEQRNPVAVLQQCIPPPSSFCSPSLTRRATVAATAHSIEWISVTWWLLHFTWLPASHETWRSFVHFFPPSLWNGFHSCQHELDSHLWFDCDVALPLPGASLNRKSGISFTNLTSPPATPATCIDLHPLNCWRTFQSLFLFQLWNSLCSFLIVFLVFQIKG